MQKNSLIGSILEQYIVKVINSQGQVLKEEIFDGFSDRDSIVKNAIECYNETCRELEEDEFVQLISRVHVDSFDGWVDESPTYNVIATFSSRVYAEA